ATNGVRLVVAGVLDVTIPGGEGWKTNRAGTRWRYSDPKGLRGAVRALDVADRSARENGRLAIKARLLGAPAVPAAGAHDVTIGFGTSAECATVHFGDAGAPSPSCRATKANLLCR